jgi:hypothetical protein
MEHDRHHYYYEYNDTKKSTRFGTYVEWGGGGGDQLVYLSFDRHLRHALITPFQHLADPLHNAHARLVFGGLPSRQA